MPYTIAEIATALEAEAVGDTGLVISGLAEPAAATADTLALAGNPKYAEALANGSARAAMLWSGADWQSLGLEAAILPVRPRFAMSSLTGLMDPGQGFAPGVHASAVIDPTAVLGANVYVGPNAVVGPGAVIGDGCILGPLSYVGKDAVLGPNCYLREHVSVGARVQIGARFIAQPGARIGGDGFSFVTPEKGAVEEVRESLGDQGAATGQPWVRIASLGSVIIGDDVDIGANTTIDSGTIRPTRVGHRVKMDNFVQVGHNVVIGDDNLLCGSVAVAGSTVTGKFVVMAGQVGVSDNLTIGNNVVLGAACKVMSSVRDGKVMLGYPAVEMKASLESYKNIRRLPRILRDVAALKKSVFNSDGSD